MDSYVDDKRRTIYIGYDPRENDAYDVCLHSIKRRLYSPIPIARLTLGSLRDTLLYYRPTCIRDGKLWDEISEAPMSTEFAISRFLTPYLAYSGWALFMDCDMLVRSDLNELFEIAEASDKAVLCVKHEHVPHESIKMDGQAQLTYERKNWSSVMLFNCQHPANQHVLNPATINTVTGRDLHRFFWLNDDEIGALDARWNYLVGYTKGVDSPCIVHYTSGGPWFADYQDVEYAQEWWQEFDRTRRNELVTRT